MKNYAGALQLVSVSGPHQRQKFRLFVANGTKYLETCQSCQVGMRGIKQAFEFIDGAALVWNKNIVVQTEDYLILNIGGYSYSLSLSNEKVVVVDVEPTLENFGEWFCKNFQTQLELAHVDVIHFDYGDQHFRKILGY